MTLLQFCLVMGLFMCAAVGCGTSNPKPLPGSAAPAGAAIAPAALTGKLDVIVRPPMRAVEPLLVTDKGALPVRAGGIMSLQVQLSELAYCYLVWLDTQQQALPLYPWNTETLEIRDLAQPPPLRQSARTIYSPLLGGGWTFGDRGGMETVLLLARRTPLPKDTNLAALIKPLEHTEPAQPNELEILALDGGSAESITRLHPATGADAPSKPASEHSLAPLLLRLAEHFELIRCARFAHGAEP